MSETWRRKVLERRTAVADSDNTSTDGEKELLQAKFANKEARNFCTNCCACKVPNKQKSKSKQTLLASRSDSKIPYKNSTYKEQLEMKVLNDEMNEQLSHEKHNDSKRQVENLIEILRTLSVYSHCLEIKHKASLRLQNLIFQVFPDKGLPRVDKDRTSLNTKKLHEILQTCSEHIELPEAYSENLDDYKDKYKDYTKASTNFCHILENSPNMSNTQLRKLEEQYDDIRVNYSESKTSISSQISDIMNKRVSVVEMCTKSLCPILSQATDGDREVYNLLRELSFDHLKYVSEKISTTKSLPDKSSLKKRDREKSCSCIANSRDGF